MKENLQAWINSMQEIISTCDFEEANKQFLEGINLLDAFSKTLSPQKIIKFNAVIAEIFIAQQNSDYLLLSDLLQYRLNRLL